MLIFSKIRSRLEVNPNKDKEIPPYINSSSS